MIEVAIVGAVVLLLAALSRDVASRALEDRRDARHTRGTEAEARSLETAARFEAMEKRFREVETLSRNALAGKVRR